MTETFADLELGAVEGAPPRAADRLARAAVHRRLARIASGSLVVVDADGAARFGDPEAALRARILVRDPAVWRALLLRGALGGSEAWLDGAWETDDLVAVIRILARNREALADLERGAARIGRLPLRALHALRANTRRGSRRNIAAHYDLGNDFFALFLDPTLTYSCGIFERPDASLEEASLAKYERICRKLALGPDDHVLEIGSGWGGFALHAARTRGCRVTTTTISRAQHALARERVAEAGLADRVEVLLEDYRDLRGSYDKLVSIEMIEAVGHRHLDAYFRVCSERLRRGGAMCLQAITMHEQDYEASTRNVDFIKRHVFPGGQCVSVGAICGSLARATDLRLVHLEELSPHYAETLRRWRARLLAGRERILALGYPERALRVFEYYLAYCEGGFEERELGVAQIVLEKPGARGPARLGRLEPGAA